MEKGWFAHLIPGFCREGFFVLAEELSVLDADAPLWQSVRPLLDAALRLDQNDDTYSWHGWNRQQIAAFLKRLPDHCTLLVGVWEAPANEQPGAVLEHESLVTGFICEVSGAEVHTLRTFEALDDADLPSIQELEPGFEDAQRLMRAVKNQLAPVAWALFTDTSTWNEWLFAEGQNGEVIDKGELLASFARLGRCVLMFQYPPQADRQRR
jgi:hypothetical protein